MKQKLIYIVLVLASMHLPSSSKECGKLLMVNGNAEKEAVQKEEPAAEADDLSALPASPLTRSFINL
ncbi:MAG: hypothetical protein QM726_15385 [Chitinophagaceae bacterium]